MKQKKPTKNVRKRPTKNSAPKKLVPRKGHIFVLRTCNADMSSAHDPTFIWPTKGLVKALDWDPTPSCGRGLHGFAKGEGDASLASSATDAKWLVVEVAEKTIVQLNGKIKFPQGRVVFVGSRDHAVAWVQAAHPEAACIYGTATAGDGGTATAGYRGTATAGDGGTATAGYRGTATAGYRGTATAGYRGTATAGDGGTATAGYRGTATAGYRGTLVLGYWDGRRRIAVADVGENGIEANVPYRLDDAGKFVRA